MTQEFPKLDVPTLEYVLSMLETETEAYREGFEKADSPVIRGRRHAIFFHMISLKSELKTYIEEQKRANQNGE